MLKKYQIKAILLGTIFLLLNAVVCNASNGEESLEPDAFATYFGGEGDDLGRAITTDMDGNIIIVGQTTSSDISTLEPTIQEYGGDEDVLIAKFSPDGQLLFYTYYGGTRQDNADGVTTDNEGNIIITGYTASTNFPTKSALYSTHNGGEYDLFILKLSSDGSEVLFSTFYGGSGDDHNYGHHGSGVTLDSNENIILSATTTSENLPTIKAIQANRTGPSDVVVLKLSKDGQELLFATYFGGDSDDFAGNCVVNSQDQIYFTGMTDSTDYPIKNGFQPNYGGNTDAFLTIIDSESSEIVYSSYFGGMGMEYGNRIGIDGEGNLILTGATESIDIDTHRAYQRSKSRGLDAYLLKFSVEDNTTIFSTYLGGDSHEWGFNVAIDQENNIYLIGQTMSENFPTRNAQQNTYGGDWDGFVAKFSKSGSLLSSSYVGGSGMDFGFAVSVGSDNNIAFVFLTESTDLQCKEAFQSENSGTVDFYIIQMKFHTVWWIWSILGVIIVSIFLLIAKHQLLKNRKGTKNMLPSMEAENKN